MFSLRIHSVDTDHPLFISLPCNSNPNFSERRGIIHLYRTLLTHPSTSHPSSPPILFIVAVPNYFSSDDLFRLFGSHISNVSDFLIIRNDGVEDRYSVLIRTEDEVSAHAFYRALNGKRFSPPEVEICHIVYVVSSEFTGLAEIASTPPPGYIELPTCPICLERLDQDTCGIQTTLCDHSFHCSCISKWTYLSCQVCRLCQQQDDKPNCSVCNTSENLWVCVICGFVGCGRYKEGHMFGHWKDTHHCYSLDLETQRVWDYEGDSYVHRLNQSKTDGKSSVVDSHCISHDGNCNTCGDGEDSEITWALFNSKVETIMDEYNHLLATQLENQRQYYESLLAEAKSKRDNVSVEATEKASSLKDLLCKLEQYEENKKTVMDMNHKLIKDQEEYKKKLEEIEKRLDVCVPDIKLQMEMSYAKSRNEQIFDLEEQIRDVKFFIAAQTKLGHMSDQDGIKGGTVLPVPQTELPSTDNKKHIRSGRRR
ncbi:hypothetical protein KSS87_001485 [Heliosperma pusillum]|nr:hypothetical protein KSS87_001485 [Heliosperma pusillum]